MKKVAQFLQLLLLLSVVAGAKAWTLDVNVKKATPGISTDVVFECRHNNDDIQSISLTNIYRIRILKLGVDNKYTQVAAAYSRYPKGITTFNGAVVTANLNVMSDTFIKLQFDVATKDILGQFICEVDGFDQLQEVKAIKTNPVTIETSNISFNKLLNTLHDLEKIVRKDHAHLTTLNLSLKTMFKRIIAKYIQSHLPSISNINGIYPSGTDYSSVNTADKLIDLLKFVSAYSKYAPIFDWPGGEYSLLKPDTGCPGLDSSVWQSSFLSVTTNPEEVKDSGSKEFNLYGNVFQVVNNKPTVHFEFCSMVTATKTPYWPKGSYCIQGHTWQKCPSGFSGGYTWYGKYGSHKDPVSNFPGYEDKDSSIYTEVYYCCRNDDEVGNPMILPRQKPFYLFRYGGKCQEVIGMKVTDQWIFMDLEDNTSDFSGEHPDLLIENDGFKLYLCYYTTVF